MTKNTIKIKEIIISLLCLTLLLVFIFGKIDLTSGQEAIGTSSVKYCCEKTAYNAFCQNAPEEQCLAGFKKTPTSCEATSFCKLGCCYDSNEGLCMENTPQKVCEDKKGTWADSKECEIPQCNLGCCVLGKQASFVTLARCKKLSGFYGLLTDFRTNIGNELDCIALASLSDEGACVFSLDYGKNTCKFTSRQECNGMKEGAKTENGEVTGNITFYKDYLCSAEELGTSCGLTKDTTCADGKDEVYFKDSCGNPANIYDAGRVDDKAYWRKKISKEESCNALDAKGNAKSSSCGNCDYFSGSICKNNKKAGGNPTYGNNICSDLNCKTTTLNKAMRHGESWCSTDSPADSVGSRYFRHLCMNGEEIIEPCADFRQEICLQDYIESKGVKFSQAGCRVNRWQDCTSQKDSKDCENADRRDCKWKDGDCYPLHAPGLKFWQGGEAKGICSKANTQCVVEFEKKGLGAFAEDIKGIFGSDDKDLGECKENCECLEKSWINKQLAKTEMLGDCGGKENFVGEKGYREGYKSGEKEVKKEDKGGLF